MNWWDLGEHSGYSGDELALYQVRCAFCDEEGNFETVSKLTKSNKASGKVLHYDTLKCGNCGNLTFVFWSAASSISSQGLHDYRTLPWPQKITKFPEHWPADVGRNWLQAQKSIQTKSWDAAALMARSAIQLVVREQKAKGANLKAEIDDLAEKGVLPPVMKEWAHELRVLGNDNAHPAPGDEGTSPADANDVVEFLTFLLRMTYTLPHDIEQFRGRKK